MFNTTVNDLTEVNYQQLIFIRQLVELNLSIEIRMKINKSEGEKKRLIIISLYLLLKIRNDLLRG